MMDTERGVRTLAPEEPQTGHVKEIGFPSTSGPAGLSAFPSQATPAQALPPLCLQVFLSSSNMKAGRAPWVTQSHLPTSKVCGRRGSERGKAAHILDKP